MCHAGARAGLCQEGQGLHSFVENLSIAEADLDQPSALRSIIAGSTAGAVEIGMTHKPPPLPDNRLTRRQLSPTLLNVKPLLLPHSRH